MGDFFHAFTKASWGPDSWDTRKYGSEKVLTLCRDEQNLKRKNEVPGNVRSPLF
jgi:hypothetical protein